jgi:hypothetical protein
VSVTAAQPATAQPTAPVAGSTLARLRRARPLIVVFMVVVLASVVIAAITRPRDAESPLDPESTAPSGSRALAQVLGDQQVEVSRVSRIKDVVDLPGRDRTLLIVHPNVLDRFTLERAMEVAEDVVLVQPDAFTLDEVGLPLLVGQVNVDGGTAPSCDLPAATAAGTSELDGMVYRIPPGQALDVTLCYPSDGFDDPNGSIVVDKRTRTTITVLGSDAVLRNDEMKERGHAALGLWTLGRHPDLVWWMVDPLDPDLSSGDERDPADLLPSWVGAVHWWLVVVAVLAIVWRGRRMGRLVPEPLPVVVRSAETARGRAALYRRAGARDRAADVLRADTIRRVARRVGLPAAAPVDEVCRAVAAALGWPPSTVTHLLTGPPPTHDAELVGLAAGLDHLVRAVSSDQRNSAQ